MPHKAVCVTTFRQGNPGSEVERVRAQVFLDTARKAQELSIPIVALITETSASFCATLERLGVTLIRQETVGMGAVRREILARASLLFSLVDHFCWVEPEKPDMIRFVLPMLERMINEESLLGLFNRQEMASYPAEQAYYYLFCRAVASACIGCDIDYAFGPMMVARSALPAFLEYGGEYGDKWESILLPRLRILRRGGRVSLLSVDFKNDPRMTAIESGNHVMVLKRLEQLNNVVPSLLKEWARVRPT